MGKRCSTNGEGENVNRILCRNIKERDHLEDLEVNGRIRLKLLLKRPVNALTGFIWLRIETNVRLCADDTLILD